MTGPGDPTTSRLDELDGPARRRLVVRSIAVSTGSIAAVLAVYFVLPWDGGRASSVVLRVAIALALLVGATSVSVLHVMRAEHPVLRAVESLAVVVSLAIVAFASVYVLVSTGDVAAFSEPLDRIDALYFSLTTSTTVGFGDINARSDAARVVVMIQMVTNVVVLGAGARVLLGTARRRTER